MHTFDHTLTHATRTAELAAEAAAWRLAREAAPAAPVPSPALAALRNRAGEALVAAGIRLMQPAHVHARVRQHAA
ncbi:hypothetical protein OOK31_31925 [Streptomyces sp. NBC_00249]|uniref:hypothetical protein n=1 Tax=Streptomyces sp. NBC_00249 TaxID=2975690 RepID=UPI002251F8CF|nr:hypothetical protein [Streptomyces sp. NBC_00249]MCX5198440.1 hypothetical protein [Streptomyces sp. NBC_00249]